MQINKEKLLEWADEKEIQPVDKHDEWSNGFDCALKMLRKEIESGTFDIKEDTDHADR